MKKCRSCNENLTKYQKKYCSRECGYKAISINMKKNNPMKNKTVTKKVSDTQKRLFKEGKITPFMCTDKGRKTISKIAKKRANSDKNPLRAMKGKTWEEFYGEKTAKLKKEKNKKRLRGEGNPSKRLDVRKKISENAKIRFAIPENNPNYIDGRSAIPYSFEFKIIRKLIIKRDKNTCYLCQKKDKLSVHHIDYNKRNNKEYNLITLCLSCNPKVNKKTKREYWTEYFYQYTRKYI